MIAFDFRDPPQCGTGADLMGWSRLKSTEVKHQNALEARLAASRDCGRSFRANHCAVQLNAGAFPKNCGMWRRKLRRLSGDWPSTKKVLNPPNRRSRLTEYELWEG